MLSPVKSDPAGGGLCGAMARTKRRSLNTRADPSRGTSAALPFRESGPPYTDRRGPAAPIGYRAHLNRRQTSGGPLAAGRRARGGSTAGLGSPSYVGLGRAAWPPAPRNRGLAPKPSGRQASPRTGAPVPAPPIRPAASGGCSLL